jgi:hypothetical protein
MTVMVRCRVKPGMFDNEYVVLVNDSAAVVSSGNVTVSHTPVTLQGVDGSVRAYLVEEHEHNAVIELPGESVIGSLRTSVPRGSYQYQRAQ